MMLARHKKVCPIRCIMLGVLLCAASFTVRAQTADGTAEPSAGTSFADSDFRVETLEVAGGAELITIFGKQTSVRNGLTTTSEMPVLSVVRDTLGDGRAENDRLRFVYMLTYTRPSFWQKVAGFVPFLYTRTTNHKDIGILPPPPLADMHRPDKAIWSKILWLAFKKIVLSEVGFGTRASALQYRENLTAYRRSAAASALAVLSMYEKIEGEKILTEQELRDIQARLWLRDETFGALMQPENLDRVYEKKHAEIEDIRGHNWELLRQYSEAAGLYFEPIAMPDGSATHAMVWIAKEDLATNKARKFEKRFLNIKNPWSDKAIANWDGYTQERWFDAESRMVDPRTRNATKRTLVPLALYGLDTKKIPGLLIDFQDRGNAKRREMSRRVLNDVTSNVLSLSRFTSVPYLVGRSVYDFATGRRGMDVNQASRVHSYAQLKTLLALDATLDQGLKDELKDRIEDVSLNPLENDLDVEAKIARVQYRNLVDYARRPDGLPAKLDRDRREEMTRIAHSERKRHVFTALHLLSLGFYTHREKATPEMVAAMDTRRQLEYHERVLTETAVRSTRPEIDTDVAQLRRSLGFVSQYGARSRDKTARSLSKIFAMATEDELRRLCLLALYEIDSNVAKNELLAIYRDPRTAVEWRDLSVQYLRQTIAEGKRISSRDAATVAGIAAN